MRAGPEHLRYRAWACTAYFASGAAALIFETIWFHQASLAFGNGVWASALVLAAFMVGLGAGNAIGARIGDRLPRPLRAFAALELTTGITGALVVWALPALGPSLARAAAALEALPALAGGGS